MQMELNKRNNVAIYCRISRDDGNERESVSIQNQKEALTKYVLSQNWNIYDYYVDDGYTGTNFDRPDFQRLLLDIGKGVIDTVCTKDLSRLGRDYIKTGYYTEDFFPRKNVRYIAINDNVDTSDDIGTDFMPIKNVINEWYAKDISKKIKFTLHNKIKNGELQNTATPVYGYMIAEDQTRLFDPETAPIVQRIFNDFIQGTPLYKIASNLKEEKVYMPGYYFYYKYNTNPQKYTFIPEEEKYKWDYDKLYAIIRKEEYKGILIRGKTKKRFKQKTQVVTKEERYIFEDKIPALIEPDIWEQANKLIKITTRNRERTCNIAYDGMVYCECGSIARICKRDNKDNKGEYRIHCYKGHQKDGTSPSFTNKELDEVLIMEVTYLKNQITKNLKKFQALVENYLQTKQDHNNNDLQLQRLSNLNDRQLELDKYIKSLFESKQDLPKDTYESMLKAYTDEHKLNEQQINQINKILNKKEEPINYEKAISIFLKTILNTPNEKILDKNILRLLISKIIISQSKDEKNKKKKKVTILYTNVDFLIEEFLK